MVFHKAIKGQGFNVFLPLSVPSANGLLGPLQHHFCAFVKNANSRGIFCEKSQIKKEKTHTGGGNFAHLIHFFEQKLYILLAIYYICVD